MRTISHIFVYFAFSTLSQLKFYNNWGLTDSLLTVQTECTYKWGHSCLFLVFVFLNVSHARLNSLQQDVCVCVCFLCVFGVACMKRELDVNGSKLSNSLFLISTANVSSRQLEAETIDMFINIYHPSNPSMRRCIYILILTADIRIEYWSYTQYVQLL